MMDENVRQLEATLQMVRLRLLTTPRESPGFGAMRSMYNQLTDALIEAADREDRELAERLEVAARRSAERWRENKDSVANWTDAARSVASAVGKVLGVFGIPNPLEFLTARRS